MSCYCRAGGAAAAVGAAAVTWHAELLQQLLPTQQSHSDTRHRVQQRYTAASGSPAEGSTAGQQGHTAVLRDRTALLVLNALLLGVLLFVDLLRTLGVVHPSWALPAEDLGRVAGQTAR